tara:strand:+ start:833 stop:1261 length:429 start_codon:yes stop_codon:yes gene_type:complete
MAHFSKIDENNIVTAVIVAEQEFINTLPDSASYIQTSFNTRFGVHYDSVTKQPDGGVALRGNFGIIGTYYNETHDVFLANKPFNSWILNTGSWSWESPIGPRPNKSQSFIWEEDAQNWSLIGSDFANADSTPNVLPTSSYNE